MTKYDKILKMFLGDYDETPKSIESPRPQDNYIYATDTRSCIRVNRELCEVKYFPHDNQPNFNRVFPTPECSLILNIEEVASAIKKVPEMEKVAVYGKEAECEECGGTGSVTWRYETDDDEYERDFDCPVCDGRGKFTHKNLKREQRNISFNGVNFFIGQIMTIVDAIHQLGHKTATVQRLNTQYSMLINVEQGVDIVVMPNLLESSACDIKLKSSEE